MFKTIKDISATNKRVLVRCDFNVPVDSKGKILDDYRIIKALPTIQYLIDNKAKIILMSHLDPESTGIVDKKYNLNKVAERLSELLEKPITKVTKCIGPEIEGQSNELESGNILMLENLRFYKEETQLTPFDFAQGKGSGQADLEFAQKLSYLGDIYINDAFSVSHRAHASIVGIPQFLPSYVGFLLSKEIEILDGIIKSPKKPMLAIIGGTKVETKSKFIDKILEVADYVIISGLIKKEINEKNIQFKYPEKILFPAGDLGAFDINEESIKIFEEKILSAETILWNGPFGKFEEKKYAKGTLAIAKAIIKSGAFSVVGGGETVEFIQKQGIINEFSHVSTGGGAMLAYLSGEELPGLEALK